MECVEQNPTTCEYVSQHLRMLTTDFVLRYKDVSKMSKSISLPGKNSDLEIIKKKKRNHYTTLHHLSFDFFSVRSHLCVGTCPTALISREQHSSLGNSVVFFFFPPVGLRYRLLWFHHLHMAIFIVFELPIRRALLPTFLHVDKWDPWALSLTTTESFGSKDETDRRQNKEVLKIFFLFLVNIFKHSH